jgi:hypothetical protein
MKAIFTRTPGQYNSVVITNHAVDRAIQRGRLFFKRLGLNSREEVKNFLKFDIRRSLPVIERKWINCPFYHNSLGLLGQQARVKFSSNLFEYRCECSNQQLKCLTVIFRSNVNA